MVSCDISVFILQTTSLYMVNGEQHVPVAVGEAVILKEGIQLHCGTADQWRVIVVRMYQR